MGNCLTLDHQLKLCAPFSDQDIKKAIFLIPNHKSPCPDRYSSGFFKATWDVTRSMVCATANQFFASSQMPPFLGQPKLVLLPKVHNPAQTKDFGPISCCTTIYKCITKLLYSRMKEVLPHLIQEQQGAFVQGRELLFNVLICQDIVRGYSRSSISPRCTIELDIHKAFDSVHWSFIKDMLSHLKFPQQFVKWVMACLTSVTYIMQMNGHQGG